MKAADKSEPARQSRPAASRAPQRTMAPTASFESPEWEPYQLSDGCPTILAQRNMQELADASPQVRHAAEVQTMVDSSPRMVAQRKLIGAVLGGTARNAAHTTGLPEHLRAGVERLSGLSLDDVRVHHDSPRPARLQALAYTEGTDIHVASGQERHLAHEVWHVVQQKQGRVRATRQMNGQGVNDDAGLEREADVMGARLDEEAATEPGEVRQRTIAASTGSRTAVATPAVSDRVAQRKILYGDARGVAVDGMLEWLDAFAKSKGYRFESRPGFNRFRTDTFKAIHIDVKNTTPAYFEEVEKLVASEDSHKRPLVELQALAPHVLITESKKYIFDDSDNQTVIFTDVEQTLEEQAMAHSKVRKLHEVVQESRHRIRSMVDLLEGLQTGEQTRESAALERTLRELLGTSSEQLGQCIGILHRIFSLMQKRLSQRVLEISTMSRSTTKGAPGTKGLSGPVNDSDWKIQGKNLAPWLTWLETDQEFGGTLAMRLDANQIVHEDYHRGLVHTFIHELSHAAASTSDFAYLHERDEYGKLTDLHRLANADTIALIAQELTKPPAPSVSKDPGENQNQPKLSQQDVKRLIIAAAGKYKDDNALQVKIYELLDAAGYEWSDFAQEPEFDPDTPLGGRLMFVMM